IKSYLAYQNYNGEVSIAVGRFNGDAFADIATVAQGVAPHARVTDGATDAALASFFVKSLPTPSVGRADAPLMTARVALGDVNGDNLADLIFASGPNSPTVALFHDAPPLAIIDQVVAFEPTFTRGARMAAN